MNKPFAINLDDRLTIGVGCTEDESSVAIIVRHPFEGDKSITMPPESARMLAERLVSMADCLEEEGLHDRDN